jgi:hypothetical protein
MSKITPFLLSLIFSSAVIHAQVSVRKLTAQNKESKLSFPVISIPNNVAAANKINDFLQINMADRTTAKTPEKDLFNSVIFQPNDPNSGSYLESLDYEIPTNRKGILSISLDGTTMAAYPDFFESTYNFNATSGDIIFLADLFTKEGLKNIQRHVRDQRKLQIQQHLSEIKKDKALMEDMDQDALNRLEDDFTSCVSYFTYNDFFIRNDSLHFLSPRCLPHVELPYDGDFPVSVAIKDWKPSLNSYGQKLLVEKTTVAEAYHASFYNRPLYGSIGKTNIVIYIDEPSESVNGFYYYASQGIRINFFGSFSNNVLHVQAEPDGNPSMKETIKATLNAKGLKGEWIQGTKRLPFTAN